MVYKIKIQLIILKDRIKCISKVVAKDIVTHLALGITSFVLSIILLNIFLNINFDNVTRLFYSMVSIYIIGKSNTIVKKWLSNYRNKCDRLQDGE